MEPILLIHSLFVILCADLPGFTRSFYKRDHALITPESHVFASLQSWFTTFVYDIGSPFCWYNKLTSWCSLFSCFLFRVRTTAAHFISPATGSHFSMYLAKMEGKYTDLIIFKLNVEVNMAHGVNVSCLIT